MFGAGARTSGARQAVGGRKRSTRAKERSTVALRRARFYRPGNGGAAFEILEERRLLSTADLTQQIDNLLSSGTTSGFVKLGNVSLGSFLTVNNVTASFQNISHQGANWSGTVTVSADTATLGLGSTFTGQIKGDAQNSVGLSGSYALDGQPLGHGAYSLSVTELDVSVPNILTGTANGVQLSYDPAAAPGQQVAHVGSLSATLNALDNVTATLNNLNVFDNGFTLADGTVTADALNIGSMLTVTSPSVTFTDAAYTVGSPLTGTIGLSSNSVTLFPGKSTTATVNGFRGSYDLSSSSLSLSAQGTTIDFGTHAAVTADNLGFALQNGGQSVTITVGSAQATLPDLDIEGSITGLAITQDGFSVASATLSATTTVALGSVLSFTNPTATFTNVDFSNTTGLTGDIDIKVQSASVLPGASAFTAKVDGFDADINLTQPSFQIHADDVDIKISDFAELKAQTVGFSLTPDTSTPGGEDVSLSVGTGKAFLPKLNLSGDVSSLVINNGGFSVGSASLSYTGTITYGGHFTLTNPSATFTDFGYTAGQGAHFNGSVTAAADEIDLSAGSASLSATGIKASLSFAPSNFGDFTFKAHDVKASLGSFLTLEGTDIAFDTAPTGNSNIAEFGSVTASFKLPAGVTLTGTGQDFAIGADGSFITENGFGVSLDVSDAGALKWPTWLPIQVQHVGIQWPNFSADPTDFSLDLSASVNVSSLAGTGLELDGFVQDAVIDVGLLEQGQFPITGVRGFGIGVGGTIFGVDVKGQLFLAFLDTDAAGNIVPDGNPNNVEVANHYFYGGIDAAFNLMGYAGFEIRLGISQFGPLDGYVDDSNVQILDPFSGLAITNFHAGIDFGRTLPDITDPKELATNPGFQPPGNQTLLQWKDQLASQVAYVATLANGSRPLSDLATHVTVDGGATLFDAYASEDSFKIDGDVLFSTDGKLEVQGDLTLGGELSLKGTAFIDLSQVASGKAQLLTYIQGPSQAPIITAYGGLAFDFGAQPPAPNPTSPNLGTGLTLNGTTDFVSADNIDVNNSSYSVEFWAQRADTGRTEYVVGQADANTANDLQIGFDANNNFFVSQGGKTLTYPMTDNRWHQWAVTFDQATGARTIYRDGQAVASDTAGALHNTSATLLIGKSGSTYFDGSVDEVRVWNVVRAAADIAANANQSFVSLPAAGLVAEWQFNEGSGTTAADSSGNNHTANVQGDPQWTTTTVYPPAPPAFGSFTITISGGVNLSLKSLPGGLSINGSAVFLVSPNQNALDLTVSGSASIDPIGSLLQLGGHVHYDDTTGTPELYGAFALQTGQFAQLQQLGVTVAGTAVLRFNTTNQVNLTDTATFPDQSTATFTLPPQSVSLDVLGTAGFQRGGQDWFSINGRLDAYFGVTTDAAGVHPLLQVYVGGHLLIGPSTAPIAQFTSNGFLQIDDTGVAADIGISLDSSQTLAAAGITLKNDTFTLLLNTTGHEVAYVTPTLTDPNQSGTVPGAGGSVDIPAAPSGTTTAQPYLQINGVGELVIKSAFDLSGSFSLLVAPNLFSFGLNMDFNLQAGNTTIESFHAQGGLVLSSAGLVADINLQQKTTLPANLGIGLNAAFQLEVNTTGSPQTVGGVTLPAGNYALVHAQGNLTVATFSLSGAFDFKADTSGVSIAFDANANVGPLGSAHVGGSLTVVAGAGVFGVLTGQLNATLPALSFSAGFHFEINTTSSPHDVAPSPGASLVHLDPNKTFIAANGDAAVAGLIDLHGEFDITINATGLDLNAHAQVMGFLGANVALNAHLQLLNADAQGPGGLVVDVGLPFSTGLGAGLFAISASPELVINTSSVARSGIAPNTYEVKLNNASLNVLGFSAGGNLIVGVSNGVFDIEVPQSNPVYVNFFGLGGFNAYGYFKSNGQFSLTGNVGFDLGQNGNELWGSISVTVASSGFSASFSGGASIFGWNVASASGTLDIQNGYVHLGAWVSVIGIGFGFDFTLGQLSPPPVSNSIFFYSVPAAANEGSQVTIAAGAVVGGGAPADGDYQWSVYRNGQFFTSGSGANRTVTLGDPGTYTVNLSVDGLNRSSTIQVNDVPPVIQNLGNQAAYAGGKPLTLTPSIYSPVPADVPGLHYQWTVTKNGQAFLTSTSPTFTFTPTTPTYSATAGAPPDVYGVALTVTDNFGGSTTSNSSFAVFDPQNIVVNTTQDFSAAQVGANGAVLTSLRVAVQAAADAGGVTYVKFDPSLAGQTVYLSTVGDTTDYGNSALAIKSGFVYLDGSNAPGVTLAVTPGVAMRLFYVAHGAGLDLYDLNVTGGYATGASQNGYGGAIFTDGLVNIFNSSLYNNVSAGAQSGNAYYQANGAGGAVFVSALGSLDAADDTFAYNAAIGAPAIVLYNPAIGYYLYGYGGQGYGGAIYSAGSLILNGNTIVDNTVNNGAGSGSPSLGAGVCDMFNVPNSYFHDIAYSNIVALNLGAADYYFANSLFAYGAGNLIGSAVNPPTSAISVPYIVSSANPLLGPFADHGDGVKTFSLLPGSPAIGTGLPGGVYEPTDGRGYPRSVNNKWDIGAFQTQPYLVSNTNDSGPGSLREAVAADDNGAPITFAPGLSGQKITLTSGPITLANNVSITGLGADQLTIGTALIAPSDEWQGNGNASDTFGTLNASIAGPAGSVTYAPGILPNSQGGPGQAFQFNGNGGTVVVPNSTKIDTPSFTIGGWFKFSQLSANGVYTLASKYGGNYDGWLLRVNSAGTPYFQVLRSSVANAAAVSSTSLNYNTWAYIAATFDGTTARIFVNGVQTASATLSGGYTPSQTSLVIGGASWYSGDYTNGLLDGFSYYNSALSPSTIQALSQQVGGTRVFTVNSGVTASISGLTISGGRAEQGAGVYNAGTLTLTNDAFTNDVAQGYNAPLYNADAGLGGAIYNASGASLVVTGSTFDVNSAIGGATGGPSYSYAGVGRGGAIYNASGASLFVSNDTFADNNAAGGAAPAGGVAGPGFGGAIDNSGTAYVFNSTLYGNSVQAGAGNPNPVPSAGAGINNVSGASLVLDNTIVAHKPPTGNAVFLGNDVDNAGSAAGAGNLITTSAGLPVSAVASTKDPQLGPLGSYGGSTPTFAPHVGSPVIDAGVNNPAVTASGVVHAWQADGNALDSVGSANGTLGGGVTYAAGITGQAFSLNGSGYVALPPSADIVGTGAFTVSAWINATASTGVIIQQRDASNFNGEYQLALSNGKVYWWTYGNNQFGFNFTSNKVVNDGNWHLITAVRQTNGTGQIYIDNALDSTQSAPLVPIGSNINTYIGGDLRDHVNYFTGLIDQVGLYNRALSPLDVQALYQQGAAAAGTDQRGFARLNNGTLDIGAGEAQPYLVTNTNDSGFGSLRAAVNGDLLGDQPVVFSPALNGQTIALTSGPITIGHDLNIVGPGASLVTVSGGNTVRDFAVTGGTVTISGLTIAGGLAQQGGGVYNAANLTLTNDVFSGNTAQNDPANTAMPFAQGGAIYNAQGGTLNVTGSTFTNNYANGLGAPSANPLGQGGAIYNAAPTLSPSGAVLVPGGVLSATDDTFNSNAAQQERRAYGTQGYNIVGYPASLPSYATMAFSLGSVYTWATGTNDPRALQNPNTAGGANRTAATEYSNGLQFPLDLSVNLTDNQPHTVSLYMVDFDSTARSVTVYVLNSGGVTLDTRTVTSFHNGVYLSWVVKGNVNFQIQGLTGGNSVVSGVFIDAAPAGVSGPATFLGVDNLTEGNWKFSPLGNGLGGAIDNEGTATLLSDTIDGNAVASNPAGTSDGAGVENGSHANLTVYNTIVANDNGGHDLANLGTIAGDRNLVMTNVGVAPSVIASTADPKLGLLSSNGGPTPTMALLAGSPAIDAGDNALAPANDQRGLARLAGVAIDIGAYEYATPIVVTNTNDSGLGSLRVALTTATMFPGSPITFAPSLAGQTIQLATELIIPNGTTIDGAAAPGLVINGNGLQATNGTSRDVYVGHGVTATIRNLSLTGGYADLGGGVYNGGVLTLQDVTVSGNTAYNVGGGIDNEGTLYLTDSTVANNTLTARSGQVAAYQGGGLRNSGYASLEGDTIVGNSALATNTSAGGGIADLLGTIRLHNTIIAGNAASQAGTQDVYVSNGTVQSSGHNIVGNTSGNYVASATDVPAAGLKLGSLRNNGGPTPTLALLAGSAGIDAGDPAGAPGTDQRGFLRASGAGIDIGAYERQPFVVTSAADSGAGSLRQALANDSDGSPVTFAPALAGQTIRLGSELSITTSVTIDGGAAPGLVLDGSNSVRVAKVASGANVTLADLSVEHGSANTGGGVLVDSGGSLTLSAATVAYNTATGNGGGIANNGTLNVVDSTIANNTAGSNGGGIDSAGMLTLLDATVGFNTAQAGGGVFRESGTINARNSIVADNTAAAAPDFGGTLTSLGHNIVRNVTGTTGTVTSDLTGVDPLLSTLANNGGPTPTLALLPGSPAVDAGDPTGTPANDQRGLPRLAGAAIDIGALESQTAPPSADAGDGYLIHEGDSVTFNAGDSTDPQGLPLTFSWDLNGDGVFGDATGVSPTLTWAQLQALGIQAQSTPYMVSVQVSDGLGGSHVVTSLATTLSVLPALHVTSFTISASGPLNTPVDSATVTFSSPIDPTTLTANDLTLTLNVGPNLTTGPLQIQRIPGTVNAYQISGLSALTSGNGQYVLTLNAAGVADSIGAGTGSASVTWLEDTVVPDSNVAPLAPVQTGTSFAVTAVGGDVVPAPGVPVSLLVACDLYVSTDGGPYVYWTTVHPWAPTAIFQGQQDHSYAFYSIGHDAAGNYETPQPGEAATFVPDFTAPVTHVTAVDSTTAVFKVHYAGSDAGGSGLDRINLFVQVDGGTPQSFATVNNSSGTVDYQAIVDGRPHSYRFYSIGVDKAGNTQPVPADTHLDMIVRATFPNSAPVPQPAGLDVQHGATERSYVRYVDIVFNQSSGLQSLIDGNHVHLIKHGLNGQGAAAVPLTGDLHVVDHAIEIDFGTGGIGGNPSSTSGDGYYELDIDGVSKPLYFDRLLGDVNGDGMVSDADASLVLRTLGLRGTASKTDVNGDGFVTLGDLALVKKSEGYQLRTGLPLSD